MTEKTDKLPSVSWQVTATTIFCEDLREEVTVMVYKDGLIKCTGFNKHPGKGASSPKESNNHRDRKPECRGPDCARNKQYRDQLFQEAD